MKIIAQLEDITINIVQKHGMFYAMIWDGDGDIVFEEECMTHSGAANRIASFISEWLIVPTPSH